MKLSLLFIITLLQACSSTERVAELSHTALEGLGSLDKVNHSFKDHCNTIHQLNNYKAIQEKTRLYLNTPNCAEWNRIDSAKNMLLRVVTAYFSGLKKLSDGKTASVYLPPVTKYLRPETYLGIDIKDEQVSAINNIADKLISASLGAYRNGKIKKFISESDGALANIFLKLQEFTGLLRTTLNSDKALLMNVYTGLMKEGTNNQQIQAYVDFTKQYNDLDKKERQLRVYNTTLKKISEAHHEVTSKINTLSKKEWQRLLVQQSVDIYSMIMNFNEL